MSLWVVAGALLFALLPILALLTALLERSGPIRLRHWVEEAGGRFTDWSGRRTIDGGEAVATNGFLHAEVLDLLREPA